MTLNCNLKGKNMKYSHRACTNLMIPLVVTYRNDILLIIVCSPTCYDDLCHGGGKVTPEVT